MSTKCAAAYLRVSTAMQERDGVSLDAQLAMARQFCEARGLTLAQTYVDTMSGQSDDRPGLTQLEADLERGAWDVVLVYKLDRLSRNAAHYHALLQRIEQRNATLASLTQPFDGTTAHGRFMLSVLIAASQLEVEVTSDRIRDSLRYRAEQGRVMSNGRSPLGYRYFHSRTDEEGRRTPGRFEVDEQEAAIVRWVFERYIARKSIAAVVTEAVDLNIRHRDGRPLSKTIVAALLRRSLYVGTYEALRRKVSRRGGKKIIQVRPREERVRVDGFPAIIDPDTWKQAQAILTDNKTVPRRLIGSRQVHVWSGLLRCASCGGAMSRQVQVERLTIASYQCRRRSSYGPTGCEAPGSVPESFLMDVAAPAVFSAINEAAMGGRPTRKGKPRLPAVDEMAATLRDIERRRDNVQDMREEGRLTREKYQQRMDRLDEEEAAARKRLAPVTPAPAPPPSVLQELAHAWGRLEGRNAERHDLLASVIQGATVEGRRAGYRIHLTLWPIDLPAWPDTITLSITTATQRQKRRER